MTTFANPPDEIVQKAQQLATQKGSLPSKSELMRAFQIGWPKAVAVHDQLAAEGWTEKAEEIDQKASPEPLPETLPMITTETVKPQGEAPSEPLPKRSRPWFIVALFVPAFVAIWSGWVDLGRLTGFGVVHPLPGIADSFSINTAITLPIGLETYAAYALRMWLGGALPDRARSFAKWSSIFALGLGAAGQVGYHLMIAAGWSSAPWPITAVVACIPVAVLGMGAALWHLVHPTP